MLSIMLMLITMNCIVAFNPLCSSCKWFIPDKMEKNDYGLCGFYKKEYNIKGENHVIYEYAIHCRNNEDMCGKDGINYEKSEIMNEIESDYNEINNRCCGEVNEKNDIETMEKELFDVLQRIKKHNIQMFYKREKDFFKLFKRPRHTDN